MTPQEEQLLNSLVERVNQTQLQEKDPDAEALLNRGLSTNQDALYILAQTVLVQNIALEQAKAQLAQAQQQIAQLQQQVQHPARATSFLGNLLGHHDPAPPPPPQPTYLPPQQQQGYAPPPPPPPGYDPQYAQPQYGPPQYGPPQYVPAGQPSFMRGAMQTAAGVAAGALAFEGVEAVLHGLGGFGHPGMGYGMGGFGMGPGMMGTGMMGGGLMGGGMERPVEENIVNNYYDQPGGAEHHESSSFDQNSLSQGNEVPHFHESGTAPGSDAHFVNQSDQGGAQFTDASYNTTSGDDLADSGQINDQGSFDNETDDNSIYDDGGLSSDDNGSSDDSGGYDDGGSTADGGGGGF